MLNSYNSKQITDKKGVNYEYSCIEDAKRSVKEAIEAIIEECRRMGTLEEVLEESGLSKIGDSWELRKPITEEELALAL